MCVRIVIHERIVSQYHDSLVWLNPQDATSRDLTLPYTDILTQRHRHYQSKRRDFLRVYVIGYRSIQLIRRAIAFQQPANSYICSPTHGCWGAYINCCVVGSRKKSVEKRQDQEMIKSSLKKNEKVRHVTEKCCSSSSMIQLRLGPV